MYRRILFPLAVLILISGLAAADPLAGRGPTVLHGGPGTTAKAEVDISHVAPLLQGHCEFEVFIDTWVSPAWVVDVELVIAPAAPGRGATAKKT